MMSFKTYIREGKHPVWMRITVASLVMKIRNLTSQIEKEEDLIKQNALIAKQNKLLSYITGLGIGIGTKDAVTLNSIRRLR
jgi:hypothetical protein